MKNRIKRGYSFLAMLLIVAAVLLGGFIFLSSKEFVSLKPSLPKNIKHIATSTPTPNPSGDSQIYESTIYDFIVTVPKNLTINEDHWPFPEFISSTKDGSITFSFNGTNYESVDEYIYNSRNNLLSQIKAREDLMVNGYETVMAQYEDSRSYLLYSDYGIYIFSTSSPELYDELEEIVQSFEYTGDEK